MTCERITMYDGTHAFACSTHERESEPEPRCACGARSTKLCDFPTDDGTCDEALCDACAVTVGVVRRLDPMTDQLLRMSKRAMYPDTRSRALACYRFIRAEHDGTDTVDFCAKHGDTSR